MIYLLVATTCALNKSFLTSSHQVALILKEQYFSKPIQLIRNQACVQHDGSSFKKGWLNEITCKKDKAKCQWNKEAHTCDSESGYSADFLNHSGCQYTEGEYAVGRDYTLPKDEEVIGAIIKCSPEGEEIIGASYVVTIENCYASKDIPHILKCTASSWKHCKDVRNIDHLWALRKNFAEKIEECTNTALQAADAEQAPPVNFVPNQDESKKEDRK